MSWKIELTLNTSAKRFEDWFDRYRQRTLPFYIDLEEGKTLLVQGGPSLKLDNSGFRRHEIQARNGRVSPTDPGALIASFPFPVVQMELFEPADNRLSLKLECVHPGLVPYHIKMLGEIAKLWPETRKPTFDYLAQFLPEEEKAVQHKTVDANSAHAGTTEKPEFSNFDPPYHEHVAKAKADDIAKFINAQIESDYSFIICHNPDGTIQLSIHPKAIENGQILIYARLNNDAGCEALGAVIEFKFIENTVNSLVMVTATCYSENLNIATRFEALWQAIVSFFPGWQEAAETGDQGARQGESKSLATYHLADKGARGLTNIPQVPRTKQFDLPRPDGFEILADKTGGTALYKRNEEGVIGNVIPMSNPGWAFEVGQKSISLKPEDVTVSSETREPKAKKVEAPKSQDIRIAKRRQKVRNLSERGEPVENIARNTGVSIATVVRDRKSLGIATPRDKLKP